MDITREQLAAALDGFHLWVIPDPNQIVPATALAGTVKRPEDVAGALHAHLSANAAHEPDPERGADMCARCGNQFKPDQVCDACRRFLREHYDLAEPGHAGTDPELTAMKRVYDVLADFDGDDLHAIDRILTWACSRWNVSV